MSDNIKLIIEIPKDYYEIIKHDVEHHLTDYRPFEIIGNGIPLDDVKAEIEMALAKEGNTDMAKAQALALSWVLELLDNIGKAESEDK